MTYFILTYLTSKCFNHIQLHTTYTIKTGVKMEHTEDKSGILVTSLQGFYCEIVILSNS